MQEEREEDSAEAVSITDDEASLVEAGGILSREEVNNITNVAPYPAVVPTTSTNPLARACAVITRRSSPDTPAQPASSTPAVHNRSVVTLRSPSIYKLAAAHLAASGGVASYTASSQVAILDSGITCHLWPFYKVFINYHCVYNQFVTLTDKSQIRITGRGTIAIEMGGKKIIIRDVYYVPDLRLPLFSLRVRRRVPGCGYHSNNDSVCCFFPTFQVDVDDEMYTYVT